MDDDGFAVRSLGATFRSGALIGWHDHDWGQLVFATSGAMWVRTERAIWLTPPTRAIWLPAGVRHSIVVRGDVSLRTLYVARDRASGLPDRPIVVAIVPLLRELILHIVKLGMLARDTPAHAHLAGLLLDLLIDAEPQDLILPLPCDARALRLADRIRGDPARVRTH